MLLYKIILVCLIIGSYGQLNKNRRSKWKRRLAEKHNRRPDQICYDTIGCFDLPHRLSPLKKIPEGPTALSTIFFLFRRNIPFSKPQTLYYEDNGLSLNQSKFDCKSDVKVIIHGYMGNWRSDGPLDTTRSYVKICNCNIIIVDWEKGAKGPQYANAAANTEVVGRQLGMLLLRMVNSGLKPQNIHLIGFSLGAHIAGCASEVLKQNGYIIGRITGLDAASPLFRHNHFRDKSKKLDKSDATLVDAIHTDASPYFTDGFGLLEPIGHVDFFPNGGFEQPGCIDPKASVVVTHLDKTITKDTACSHLRAWHLFIESLEMKLNKSSTCEFTAYKCISGVESFREGKCFPDFNKGTKVLLDRNYRNDIGIMGNDVRGSGIMYLATRNKYPFCGMQLQTSILLSNTDGNSTGEIHLKIEQGKANAVFRIHFTLPNEVNSNKEIHGLSVTQHDDFHFDTKSMGTVMYTNTSNGSVTMAIDRITVRDIEGRSWNFCKGGTVLQLSKPITIVLNVGSC